MPATRNIPEETLRAVLADHYPTIICDHEAKTDRAQCSCCSYEPRVCRNVGEAVKTWIDHVVAELDERAAAEPEAKAAPGGTFYSSDPNGCPACGRTDDHVHDIDVVVP